MRFSVYLHKLVISDGTLIERKFIVLKDENGLIVRFTNFDFLIVGKQKIKRLESTSGINFDFVVQLLNYAFFDEYHIERLTDLDIEIVKSFLRAYGLCELKNDTSNTHRSKQTVTKCMNSICSFIEELCRNYPEAKIKPGQLFRKEQKLDKSRRKYYEVKVPIFEIYYREKNKKIFRDIPEAAFQIIFNRIYESYPNILMLVALGAFAGLRPSEACNVRRADSKLGSGINFETIDGKVVNVFIDLNKELNLRSDLVKVGKIKKERTARVYPRFIPAFMDCYERYMKYIEGKPYELQYGPLTTVRNGKAMTYASYYDEFKQAINECIPEMLASSNPKVVIYGQLLLENNLSMHVLRHFFSAKLVLYGEGVDSLMFWRGDNSPESALTYINNKSDIAEKLNTVMDTLFDYSLKKSEKLYGDNH